MDESAKMQSSSHVPYARIGAEGFAIVSSILLAFAIDAWWAERVTDEWQASELAALRVEFSENVSGLELVAQTHARNAAALETLLMRLAEVTNGKPVSVDVSSLVALVAWRTSDIATGTLDALVSSGRLGDISNPEIRRQLAAWPAYVSDAQEDENLARDFAETVLAPILVGQGILEIAYSGRPMPGVADQPLPSDSFVTITPTPELRDLARARAVHSRLAAASLVSLQDRIREILELIDDEIESH